jgi:hypothetical protein
MYPKTVTSQIIHYQALGFTASETQDVLQEKFNIKPHLNTIYNHRRSPYGVEILCELIRHQERDILKCSTAEDRELAMKYRDKLIEKLMDRLLPKRFEADVKSQHTEKILHVMVSAKMMKDDPRTVGT